MSRREAFLFSGILILLGAGWGFTQPMTKIAVSEGYRHFGLVFWQSIIGAALMAALCAARGVRLPLHPAALKVYLIISLIGTVLPNSLSYQSAVHLPAGIISILLSMIPMLAFPLALGLRLDRFEWRRLGGLVLGMVAVLMIVVPGESLAGAIPLFWVMMVLIVCIFYAFEGNYVAKWGTAGLDALQVMFGASIVSALLTLPLALATGQWVDPRPPWGAPDYALMASSTAHVLVYATYVWLVGRAGPVFTVQVSYLVTLFGLLWARLILGEAYAPTVWFALALMMLGMYLVQPRRAEPLAQP